MQHMKYLYAGFWLSCTNKTSNNSHGKALKVAANKWSMGCGRCYFAVLCMVLLLPLMMTTVRCSRTVLGSPYQGVGAAASCPQVTRLMCSVHQSLAPVSHLNIASSSLHYTTGSATTTTTTTTNVPLSSSSYILYQHPALPKGTSKCTANLYATRLWCSKWEEDYENRKVLPGRQISDTCKSCLCTNNNNIISVLKCVKAWLTLVSKTWNNNILDIL